MNEKTILLIIGAFLFYEYSKKHANPQPGDVNFVGPVQGLPSAMPITAPLPPANAGLQTCSGNDGGTFFWPTNQNCPYVDFVQNGVPYYIDAIGNPIPQTY